MENSDSFQDSVGVENAVGSSDAQAAFDLSERPGGTAQVDLHHRDIPGDTDRDLRKAAVLLASIPEADAEYLLRQLDEPQLILIAKAAKTSRFQLGEQNQVLREMLNVRMKQCDEPLETQVRPTTAELNACQSRKLFSRLSAVPAPTLVRLVEDELPQTIAIVLANLEPKIAAEVLERLPSEKQLATTMRIAELRSPDSAALAQVATAMIERLDEINSPPHRPLGGAVHIARIFRHLSSATEKALLANVSHENKDLVKSVSRHLAVLRQLDATVDASFSPSTARKAPRNVPRSA